MGRFLYAQLVGDTLFQFRERDANDAGHQARPQLLELVVRHIRVQETTIRELNHPDGLPLQMTPSQLSKSKISVLRSLAGLRVLCATSPVRLAGCQQELAPEILSHRQRKQWWDRVPDLRELRANSTVKRKTIRE